MENLKILFVLVVLCGCGAFVTHVLHSDSRTKACVHANQVVSSFEAGHAEYVRQDYLAAIRYQARHCGG